MRNIRKIFFLILTLHLMWLKFIIDNFILIIEIPNILSNIIILLKVLILMIRKLIMFKRSNSKNGLKWILYIIKISVEQLTNFLKFSIYIILKISFHKSILELSLILIVKLWISKKSSK